MTSVHRGKRTSRYDGNRIVGDLVHPIPACKIVAVTLPPTLLKAFIVSRVAPTGAPWSPVMVARVRQRLQA
jgi:hypothetical protein